VGVKYPMRVNGSVTHSGFVADVSQEPQLLQLQTEAPPVQAQLGAASVQDAGYSDAMSVTRRQGDGCCSMESELTRFVTWKRAERLSVYSQTRGGAGV
jgi:hypothetical protein